MHFANTSELLASLSDSLDADSQQAAQLMNLLVFHPDPEEFDLLFGEFE